MLTTTEWIQKAKEIHGDTYDYSKSVYTGSKNNIIIICPTHGEFSIRSEGHISSTNKKGCPKCSKRSSKEEWVKKAINTHGNLYDYSKVEYITARDKVIITCLIHGEFLQKAASHLEGVGCPKCFRNSKKLKLEEFIERSTKIHDNKYDYSKVVYVDAHSKVTIICPIHGDFEQEANSHILGKGCIKCKYENQSIITRKSLENVILDFKKIHNNLYDYSNVEYVNNRTSVKIICHRHGEFLQTPDKHLQGHGCPTCNSSKGELLISNWLKENNIKFKAQFELITPEIARNSNKLRIDFFVKHNNKQYFIEYDGIQHFEYNEFFHKTIEGFEKQQRRDRVLNDFCELHNDKITLIRFKYDETNQNIIEQLTKHFMTC